MVGRRAAVSVSITLAVVALVAPARAAIPPVDTTPPPTIDTPHAGGVTGQARPEIGGHGAAGDTIEVSDGRGAAICASPVGLAGTWSCRSAVALNDGPVSFTATATDPAGHVTPGAATTFAIDTTPPAAPPITFPLTGSYLADPQPVITGTAETGTAITVADATGLAVCTAIAGPGPLTDRPATEPLVNRPAAGALRNRPATGSAVWQCRPARPFGDGPRRLIGTATDQAGNSTPGPATTFTVDTVAPVAPRLTAPAPGLVTRVARIIASGTSEPRSVVAVRAGDNLLCATVTGPDGTWACQATDPVPDGPAVLRATATDRAGHATAGATVPVTVDTVPPPVATITSPVPGEIVLTATPLIRGTGEAGAVVIVEGSDRRTVCVAIVPPDGAWSCPTFTDLPDGDFTLNTYALDAAGNSTHGTAIRIRVGAAQPVAATITAPGDGAIVSSATPLLGGAGSPGDTVQVLAAAGDGPAVTACVATVTPAGSWSCRSANALPQGRVTLMPTTVDPAGTQIPGSAIAVTVDSVPPAAPKVTAPAAGSTVRTATPTLSGRGEAGTVVEVTGGDGGTVCAGTVGADGRWSCRPAEPFPAGPARVTPTATDPAGNATPGNPVTLEIEP